MLRWVLTRSLGMDVERVVNLKGILMPHSPRPALTICVGCVSSKTAYSMHCVRNTDWPLMAKVRQSRLNHKMAATVMVMCLLGEELLMVAMLLIGNKLEIATGVVGMGSLMVTMLLNGDLVAKDLAMCMSKGSAYGGDVTQRRQGVNGKVYGGQRKGVFWQCITVATRWQRKLVCSG